MRKFTTLFFLAAAAATVKAADWGAMSASDHSMLLDLTGKIYVSGSNRYGQLGDGHYFDSEVGTYYDTNVFKPVEAGDVKFRYVNASIYSAAAIAFDGTLYTWGQNGFGQLGQVGVGVYGGVYTPTKVNDDKWAKVKGRAATMIGIHTDGTLWSWGRNTGGALGLGLDDADFESASTPTQIGTDRWMDCTSGYYHSAAVKADGTLWAWGQNSQHQVSNGSELSVVSPMQIGTDTDWKQVNAGLKMTAALKADGTLWTWGNNSESALGRTTADGYDAEPMQVIDHVVQFAVGDLHVLAVKDDGTLWGWGYNLHGEMGNGTLKNVDTPTQIGTAQWEMIACGSYHSMGMQIDGSLWTWGWNRYGQLGLGDDNNRQELTECTYKPGDGAVESIAAGASVKVYPTVVDETVNVSADGTIESVAVYGANGQKMGFKQVGAQSTQLNVSHLAAGTYFVVVKGEASQTTARFIKK